MTFTVEDTKQISFNFLEDMLSYVELKKRIHHGFQLPAYWLKVLLFTMIHFLVAKDMV